MAKKRKLAATGACAAAYAAACLALSRLTGDPLPSGLAWNLLLALLPGPLLSAALARRGVLQVGLAALWLLFLPNTFYLLTDLIHVPPQMEWLGAGERGAAVLHSEKASQWALVLLIGIGAFWGVWLGLESLSRAFDFARSRAGRLPAWAAVGALALLCGTGIYIGRFLRLNSWDALHPLRLLGRVTASLDGFACKIILLLAASILLLFCFYRARCPGVEAGAGEEDGGGTGENRP